MFTIKEIIKVIANREDDKLNLWHYLGDFLDYFYDEELSQDERARLVAEEPEEYDNIGDVTYAFMAGTVQEICGKYNVQCPKWTMKRKYFLKEPYFSLNAKGDLRLVLLAESPIPFRMRNIFTSSNTLDRA